MKRISTTISMAAAAAALTIGALAPAGYAQASNAGSGNDTIVDPQPTTQVFEPLACNGTTGSEGCGPGWFWRWGERGWACYPC